MRSKVEVTVMGVRIVGEFYVVDVFPKDGSMGEEFTVPLGDVKPEDHPRLGDTVTVAVLSEGLA